MAVCMNSCLSESFPCDCRTFWTCDHVVTWFPTYVDFFPLSLKVWEHKLSKSFTLKSKSSNPICNKRILHDVSIFAHLRNKTTRVNLLYCNPVWLLKVSTGPGYLPATRCCWRTVFLLKSNFIQNQSVNHCGDTKAERLQDPGACRLFDF